MMHYRAYPIAPDGKVLVPTHVHADSDEQAIEEVKKNRWFVSNGNLGGCTQHSQDSSQQRKPLGDKQRTPLDEMTMREDLGHLHPALAGAWAFRQPSGDPRNRANDLATIFYPNRTSESSGIKTPVPLSLISIFAPLFDLAGSLRSLKRHANVV